MITTVTTTTATVGANIISIGIFAIIGLIVLLIIRDILMCAKEDVKNSSPKTQQVSSSFLRSSAIFIIPLIYAFASIIIYKIIVIL
ncbi:MAG: hypothetical protein COS45_00280 [Candidatus Huberarchaeum crystalense]|uniref:Uncharacterized protein n=1 Tax=Huberarchaeum crystalense TaxID=2014257 RepID=A0A2H9M2Z5_HUBC1|nr:MAG: hypothetical protein COS45_00280 [Candidatus Huberarchaeum crystalense]